ncbi:site-specific tyrosine recombinase XerS [Paucilactobacillus suebicus DSM 5007 = KCTC 3549]|uniref:Site-specific tyrosine recombinase XerS n=1 Tax=Paucilactobacillus suebicus DSM 5007 = KCTC 3549 TaxID=1423807 RepID=A0A0R1W7F0_9LACO|nr:site-specific tyrosine recombinase XerS [Paucilactobacillus suebicus DSM 5007 = KCTC 3549]
MNTKHKINGGSVFLQKHENQRYNHLIEQEIKKLPYYVREYQISSRRSIVTLYQYLTEYRRFFDWLRHNDFSQATNNTEIELSVLEKLRQNDIMLYLDFMRNQNPNKPLSNGTMNRTINALKSLYKYLTVTSDNNNGEPYFYRNVMNKIETYNTSETLNYRAHKMQSQLLPGQKQHDFLDFIDSEYLNTIDPRAKTQFKNNKPRDLAIIALILATGVRVSECADVDLADLNLSEQILNVVRKGGAQDTVPIADFAVKYLTDYLATRSNTYQPDKMQHALFLTIYHGATKRISVNAIEKMVKKYSTAFGRPLHPHSLRHNLASSIYQKSGGDIELVSQQLGQKGTSATSLYTHLSLEEQRKALKDL